MNAQVFDFADPLPPLLYWDASFLVHATYPAGRYHRACYAFLKRLSHANTLSYISTLTLDESVFALIRLRTVEDHPGREFWTVYRENPASIRPYLDELRMLIDRLSIDPRIRLVGVEQGDMPVALDYMDLYSFLPRDALHLAVMARLGISHIATTDGDFLAVEGLGLFTANPRLLALR